MEVASNLKNCPHAKEAALLIKAQCKKKRPKAYKEHEDAKKSQELPLPTLQVPPNASSGIFSSAESPIEDNVRIGSPTVASTRPNVFPSEDTPKTQGPSMPVPPLLCPQK